MKTVVLAVAQVLITLPSFAITDLKLTPDQQEKFAGDLAIELSDRVRTMKREVKVYHYGTRGNQAYSYKPSGTWPETPTGSLTFNDDESIDLKRDNSYTTPVELDAPEAKDYFRAMAGMFTSHKLKWNVGPGLYAAVDPVQSESYTGTPWFMLEITIPKGSRYLDLRPFDGLIVTKKFAQEWFAGETSGRESRLVRLDDSHFVIEWRDILERPTFRKLVNESLQTLKIDELAYGWDHHTIQFCIDRSMNGSIAFNFIEPKFLERGGRVRVFVQNLEDHPSPQKAAAYSAVLDKIEMSRFSFTTSVNQSSQYIIANDDDSIYNSARMRLYSLGWAQKLQRESLILKWISKDGSFEQLYDYYVNRKCPPTVTTTTGNSSYTNICPTPKTVINEENFSVSTREDKNGTNNDWVYTTYTLDPLEKLRQTDATEYKRRLSLIERDLFGCSGKEEFEFENSPPNL